MEGTFLITLRKPLKFEQDNVGQPQYQFQDIQVYAQKQERGGRESTYSDTRAGIWQTRFEIRATPLVEDITESWQLVDLHQNNYNIESVTFAPYWGGRQYIWIYAIRTERLN